MKETPKDFCGQSGLLTSFVFIWISSTFYLLHPLDAFWNFCTSSDQTFKQLAMISSISDHSLFINASWPTNLSSPEEPVVVRGGRKAPMMFWVRSGSLCEAGLVRAEGPPTGGLAGNQQAAQLSGEELARPQLLQLPSRPPTYLAPSNLH